MFSRRPKTPPARVLAALRRTTPAGRTVAHLAIEAGHAEAGTRFILQHLASRGLARLDDDGKWRPT